MRRPTSYDDRKMRRATQQPRSLRASKERLCFGGTFPFSNDLDKYHTAGSFYSMKEAAQIQREIDALRESIQRDWPQIAASGTTEQRESLRQHLRVCIDDLAGLLARLESGAGAEMRKT